MYTPGTLALSWARARSVERSDSLAWGGCKGCRGGAAWAGVQHTR